MVSETLPTRCACSLAASKDYCSYKLCECLLSEGARDTDAGGLQDRTFILVFPPLKPSRNHALTEAGNRL